MFMAVHACVGAIAGESVQQPAVAFALGVISHFFLDMIPHGDEKIYRGYYLGNKVKTGMLYVGADGIATWVLIIIFFWQGNFSMPLNAALGILGGILPDLLVGLSSVLRPKRQKGLVWRLDKFKNLHRQNHVLILNRWERFKNDIPFWPGLVMQFTILAVLVRVIA